MALVLKDRVKQSSITTGTGAFELSAVFLGFQSFSDAIGNGNTTYYAIYHENNNEWEVGVGTVSAGSISRNTVLSSSNGNALVNFSVGNKVVFCDYPASKAVYLDQNNNAVINNGIVNPKYVNFDTSYTTLLTAGQLGWDGNNTLGLGMAGGNVIQHIGEDQFFYCKATSAITKGQVVMFTGAVGASGVPKGAPATGITDGTYIMGIAAENIANNGFGLVQTFGTLRNVNTSSYADGDILWYDPAVAGGLTKTKPSAPNVKVQMAAVINGGSSGGGTILIRINSGSTLGGTDSNVQITSPTTGQSLVYNSTTGIWTNSNAEVIIGGTIDNTPIGSTTPSTGAFTTLNSTGQTDLGTGSAQFIRATGGATSPTLSAQGSGTNVDLNLTTKGTGSLRVNTGATSATQFQVNDLAGANIYWAASGGIGGTNRPTFTTAGNTTATSMQIANHTSAPIILLTGNTEQFRVSHTASAVNYVQIAGSTTGNATIIQTQGSDTNVPLNIVAKGTSPITLLGGGGAYNIFEFHQQASTVNRFRSTATGTGVSPLLASVGPDTNIPIRMRTQGTGAFQFETGSSGNEQFRINNAASAVNYVQVSGNSANNSPEISVAGSDTNIPLTLESKGTGAINFAGGSRGVNISNGMTVTAITRTSAGSNYTLAPTVTISPPTTAGGVQATASAFLSPSSVPTITSGGTGYSVNDILTFSGGTGTQSYQVLVTAVSGGVITAVSAQQTSLYTTPPANPISVTGGTGTGATFTVSSYAVTSTFTITNAGSGYVEQPTVTFSGGGGSGAAAYATVGSGTAVRTLGGQTDIFADNTPIVHIRAKNTSGGNPTNATSAFGFIPPQSNFGAPVMGFISAPIFIWGGTGTAAFQSNATNPQTSGNSGASQFAISHTASAVNYVQVTGAATTARPQLSAQGSDTNIGITYTTKGNGIHFFTGNSGNQFAVQSTASAVNYLSVAGSAANASPALSCVGTDTNLDLILTPKGTGRVQFGTYTATVSSITGYIEIKDAGGTIRRLAVVA